MPEFFIQLMEAAWLPPLLFGTGFVLLLIEMFHPGFGFPGIMGIILLFAGILLKARTLIEAMIMLFILLLLLAVALSIVLHSATKGKLSKTLVLNTSANRESGYIGTEDLRFFLGREGFATTVLRPSGTANFDGVLLDVVSESAFIPKNTRVQVVKVEGRRIVVRGIAEGALE